MYLDFFRKGLLLLAVLVLTFPVTGCALQSTSIQPADPGQNEAVVFDIDGTLTPRPFAVFKAREHAAEAVRRYADQDVAIVYLTARVTMLQSGIPDWLEKHDFPQGSIHVTESSEDRRDHAVFKTRVLAEYSSAGWTFVAAYGDSSTDFEAYAAAGISQDRVFALQREGQEECQPGVWAECLVNWENHVQESRGHMDLEDYQRQFAGQAGGQF